MKRECSGRDVPDVTLQKEIENHKFTFISEEINAWNTFWNISKLTALCSEKSFSKSSYYTETSQMISNAKQLAGLQIVHSFSERYFQTGINPFPANVLFKQTRSLVFTRKMFEKHLWKSSILSKDAGHWPVSLFKMSLYHRYFLAYFASKNQLPGFSMSGILEHWLEMSSVRFSIHHSFISHSSESDLYWVPLHVPHAFSIYIYIYIYIYTDHLRHASKI